MNGLSNAIGCAIQPTWELMSLYEHPDIIDGDGNPVRVAAGIPMSPVEVASPEVII